MRCSVSPAAHCDGIRHSRVLLFQFVLLAAVLAQMLNTFMASVDKQISSTEASVLGKSSESLDEMRRRFREQLK